MSVGKTKKSGWWGWDTADIVTDNKPYPSAQNDVALLNAGPECSAMGVSSCNDNFHPEYMEFSSSEKDAS
eukprot:2138651-Ditylum_brightwellii.AAC.1